MTYFDTIAGNFYIGDTAPEVTENTNWELIADKPSEDYYFDGLSWITHEEAVVKNLFA